MGNVSLSNVFNILSRIAFGSVIVLPLSLSNYNLSHQEGLSLKYSKTAPPLAIFDDEKIPSNVDEITLASEGRETLQSSRLQMRKLALKISNKFASLQKINQTPTKREIRFLAGMSIQKNSPAILAVQKTMITPTRTIALVAPKAQLPSKTQLVEASAAKNYLDQNKNIQTQITQNRFGENRLNQKAFAESIAPNLRERVEEIENFDEIANEDYGSDSFEDHASAVLAQSGSNPNSITERPPTEREIANTFGIKTGADRLSYAQRVEIAKNRANRIAKNFANSGYTKGGGKSYKKSEDSSGVTPKETTDEKSVADAGVNDSANEKIIEKNSEKGTTIASRNNNGYGSNLRQALLSGPLEMTKGLALTGNQKIIVYRQIGGTRYGYGQVFLDQGRYEIFVDEPSTGVVIAELLEGENMIGRAEILMPEVMLNAKSEKDFKNVPIKIEPILDQVVAENISAYSYYKKEKLKNSQIKISDTLNANQRIFNSSIVMKATKESYWGNIILGSSKQVFTHILNPDSTIEALKEILGIRTPKEEMGIIKGEVSIGGKHISGAQVEIVGSGADSLKPVYFNSFIPDTSLTETTQNGQYAFVGVAPGSYLVRAKYKGKYLSPKLAPVEAGFVTQVQFDVQKASLAEAFVFDIQTSEMMSANINFLGSEQHVPIQARKLISFSGDQGVQFLEAQSTDQNYYATRMTVDKSEKEILIPMISQSWLNDLLARLRVTILPDTGLVIGTAQELSYSVELDPSAYNEDTKIIYFDSQGKMVLGATMTPARGGFVAINVNQGIRSLFNKYQGTQNIKVTTMAVDSSAINIFTSKF